MPAGECPRAAGWGTTGLWHRPDAAPPTAAAVPRLVQGPVQM